MLQPQTATSGLDLVIRNAKEVALQAGRHDIVARLEGVLEATERALRSNYLLDLLAAEVHRDGTIVSLSRGERALLIAMSLQKRPCMRDELVEMLYPHLDATVGAIQLKVYIHRVRRRLGDATVIVFQNESYRLGQHMVVDFWDVEAGVAEAMRSRGELDETLRIRLMQIRERLVRRDLSWLGDRSWCANLERRLEALLFDATIRLGESALASKNIAIATRLASEVFDLDPCDERGAELAIRADLAIGDHASATRQFRRYERTLKEEFGAKPSPELTRLIAVDGVERIGVS